LVLSATRSGFVPAIVSGMSSPLHVAYTFILLLVAFRLAATYLGGHYVCPNCGARSANRHSDDCPWHR
jgi:hypothetical protein